MRSNSQWASAPEIVAWYQAYRLAIVVIGGLLYS
jgi:hypothetical protein